MRKRVQRAEKRERKRMNFFFFFLFFFNLMNSEVVYTQPHYSRMLEHPHQWMQNHVK